MFLGNLLLLNERIVSIFGTAKLIHEFLGSKLPISLDPCITAPRFFYPAMNKINLSLKRQYPTFQNLIVAGQYHIDVVDLKAYHLTVSNNRRREMFSIVNVRCSIGNKNDQIAKLFKALFFSHYINCHINCLHSFIFNLIFAFVRQFNM